LAPYTVAAGTNFDGASITRRGDWNGAGYEDLVAAQTAGTEKKIHVYPNNGLGWACTARSDSSSGASQACVLDRQELRVYESANKRWADADQILAIGDVDGGLDADGDGTVDVPGHTDLIVKEGDHLWLYYGSDSGYLDEYA